MVNELGSTAAARQYVALDEGMMVTCEAPDDAYRAQLFPNFRGSLPNASQDWMADVAITRAEPWATVDELATKCPAFFG